jgi:hypothetical protein
LDITIHNPQHVSRGVIKMEVDGVPVEGNLLVLEGSPKNHQVTIWMGN